MLCIKLLTKPFIRVIILLYRLFVIEIAFKAISIMPERHVSQHFMLRLIKSVQLADGYNRYTVVADTLSAYRNMFLKHITTMCRYNDGR